jgi:hypothetical protein
MGSGGTIEAVMRGPWSKAFDDFLFPALIVSSSSWTSPSASRRLKTMPRDQTSRDGRDDNVPGDRANAPKSRAQGLPRSWDIPT